VRGVAVQLLVSSQLQLYSAIRGMVVRHSAVLRLSSFVLLSRVLSNLLSVLLNIKASKRSNRTMDTSGLSDYVPARSVSVAEHTLRLPCLLAVVAASCRRCHFVRVVD
jgi:Zn-dependent membrane protease YugP